MQPETGIIILSRYNSSRLPGKALKCIHDKEVLTYIIERLLQVVRVDQIVLATSSEKSDDPIASYALKMGVQCFRGSLENVSERFYQAAKMRSWEFAVRINGDNIFVDTILLKSMLQLAAENKYDFISNVKGRTFPRGMSIEIVRMKYYESVLPDIAISPSYREHVTLYLYEHEEGKNHYYLQNKTLAGAADIQLALDTQEDFDRSKKIIDAFKAPHWTYNLHEILEILKSNNYG